ARARKRSSPVVAPLSKVPWSFCASPAKGFEVVSVFFGQLPSVDWWERMLDAMRFPSSLRNHSSGLAANSRAREAAKASTERPVRQRRIAASTRNADLQTGDLEKL